MTQIDWSKAPKGATHFEQGTAVREEGFMRKDARGWSYWSNGSWVWRNDPFAERYEHLFISSPPAGSVNWLPYEIPIPGETTNHLVELEVLRQQAKSAHAAVHALGLPGGTDITVALVPAVNGLLTAQQDHQRLVRELDVLLNGEAGAAQQASLCDLVSQVAKDGVVTKTQLHKLEATMENVIMAGTSGSRGMRNFIAEAKKALDEVKEVL